MEIRKCKNKECRRPLPGGYKYRYCENCRNEQVKRIKDTSKKVLSVVVIIGGPVVAAVTKGKINLKKKD